MKTIRKLIMKTERVTLEGLASIPIDAKVVSSACIARLAGALIGDDATEAFCVVHLNVRHKIIGYTEVARGGLTACMVAPSSVLRAALLSNAAAVIFIHNHPSGDPTPSPEDCALTKRLVQGCALLGITVLDHVIIGHDGHFSFLDANLMPKGEYRND